MDFCQCQEIAILVPTAISLHIREFANDWIKGTMPIIPSAKESMDIEVMLVENIVKNNAAKIGSRHTTRCKED